MLIPQELQLSQNSLLIFEKESIFVFYNVAPFLIIVNPRMVDHYIQVD